jgi:hypothetical protein
MAAGSTMCRYLLRSLAPIILPALSSGGGTSSMPVMTPAATLGAAPGITTNKTAVSVRPKKRITSGNQAIDGMVCSPASTEPMARRSARH